MKVMAFGNRMKKKNISKVINIDKKKRSNSMAKLISSLDNDFLEDVSEENSYGKSSDGDEDEKVKKESKEKAEKKKKKKMDT